MRLIYYGLFDKPSDCENLICTALTKAGVLVYRWQKQIGRLHSDWEDFINYTKKEKIDIVLISKAPELTPYKLNDLKLRTGCKVVWWTFDWMNHPSVKKWYFPLAKVSDICFQTDGFGEEELYKQEGINRIELHQAIDPSIHYSDCVDTPTKDIDVSFLGSVYSKERIELDKFLRSTYGNSYTLWGGAPGFEKGVWNKEFRESITRTKVVVGDNFVNDIPGYWSDRVYLTLGCGGYFLTRYVKGLEKEFDIGKELDVWFTFEDLKIKIDLALKDEVMRNDIAFRGAKKVQFKHTYNERIRVFLEKIKELL